MGALTYRPGSETPEGDPELAARFPLTLLTRKQHVKFLNSSYGGFANHLPREGAPRLEIHVTDADERGISGGDSVDVFNDRGSMTLDVTISDAVQPGVISMPFGWWNGDERQERGVNILTNPAVGTDGIGSAAFHENLVQVVSATTTAG